VSAILRPSDKEEAMVPVPVWLRSLHYLVRPARLVWKYTFTLRRPADKRSTWRNIEW
jgi:hypothetical protein